MSNRRGIATLIVIILIIAAAIWLYNRKHDETATPILSVSALNQTKNTDATKTPAAPLDVIVYTLTAENQSDKTISGYIMEVNISEITDKASILNASGASYNAATNSLVWTPLDIPANSSIEKQFSVKVNESAATGSSTVMKVKFNNEVTTTISKPAVAGSTTPPYVAPSTGASGWIPVFLALITTGVVINFRKQLLAKI